MNYSKIEKADLVNGPGIRVSLFVSGCTLACPGCFNREAQNFKFGQEYTRETEDCIVELLRNDWIQGLSILGGEPFHEKNLPHVLALVRRVAQEFPFKDIYIWSGYKLNELKSRHEAIELLGLIDVLVDGRFEEDKKDLNLQWRGSSNQRILKAMVDF